MSRLRTTISSVTKAVGSTDLTSKFSRFKPGNATADSGRAVGKAEMVKEEGEESVAEPGKQKEQVHPAILPNNMTEMYKVLSRHVNSYFGSNTQSEVGVDRQKKRDETKTTEVPTTPPSSPSENSAQSTPTPTTSMKGFPHYLSYPPPSVQAFFSNYIAPLVPTFTGDSKREETEADKGAATASAKEVIDSAAEKAKKAQQQRLSQREKIIARVSVDSRTRSLAKGLQGVTDVKLLITRLEEFSFHLLEFSETRGVAIKENVVPRLLQLREAPELPLQAAAREALALVGYTDPVKGRGIRVLAIDGGGTRGLLALQTLYKLQELTGKQIHQLFDYICGVSTGAVLAFMLGIFQISLEECEDLYRNLGSSVFKQNVIVGTVKMGWSHAFYDSETWERILKEKLGEGRMIWSARDPRCPKVSAVSAIVNRGVLLKAFLFRNYRLLPGVRSRYLGDCKHKMWQAIRASSAAPGYFEEYVLGKDVHQDGGLLINNPTALAIHECKCLWPNTPLQCVLSLGTGRYETVGRNDTTHTSLKTKITQVIGSATDTEEVHTMLDALLPPDTYFRFNPYMSEDIQLNENRKEKLDFLKSEGERYLEYNDAKLKKVARVLAQEKGVVQRVGDWARLKAHMYDGKSVWSKL